MCELTPLVFTLAGTSHRCSCNDQYCSCHQTSCCALKLGWLVGLLVGERQDPFNFQLLHHQKNILICVLPLSLTSLLCFQEWFYYFIYTMLVLPTPCWCYLLQLYFGPNCFERLFDIFIFFFNLFSFKEVSSTASSLNLLVTLRHDLQTEENLQQINTDILILFFI